MVTNNVTLCVAETITVGTAPALFTTSQTGLGAGAFLHGADFSGVGSSSPATAGEVILLYATGLGAVSPAGQTGALASASSVTGTVTVTIGGQTAVVQYAGLAPGFAGLYQINVVVPSGIPSGDNAVVVSVDGTPATGQATVAIK